MKRGRHLRRHRLHGKERDKVPWRAHPFKPKSHASARSVSSSDILGQLVRRVHRGRRFGRNVEENASVGIAKAKVNQR